MIPEIKVVQFNDIRFNFLEADSYYIKGVTTINIVVPISDFYFHSQCVTFEINYKLCCTIKETRIKCINDDTRKK